MGKRCGMPSRFMGSVSSVKTPDSESVRAMRGPPEPVLNIAHGRASNLTPKPACWYGSPVNVATNSSEWPGPYTPTSQSGRLVAHVPTRAPSTVSFPPPTATDPPTSGCHNALIQPDGRLEP